ncbi:MAG: tRNA (uridine(34)/cytosine(34)/5-carboxymethylaminomethyluridine(34)-2'-O)-methyltransferase TrmL [Proteobacteria bacterium]|nr:tRNA (uridine(34)/cytosine(34)/5-carboxymethylaminomethyluridine(34)-2'-O)-methyltransferase TrmL [Pseudomonadota bacterium]
MLAIILFQPEIPPNTGNIIRLCANTGYELHLVKPLGFPLEDTRLKRAGLDYHEYANLVVHDSWEAIKCYFQKRRIIAIETCGASCYSKFKYSYDDVLLFGSETKGLPDFVLNDLTKENIVRLPMLPKQRSLNLSNSVAIVAYEAWRQLNFIGGI